ncbi:MAG TPA: cation transporter [Rhodothermales bacterium]|nr:cation transporter [Rhodothermales bacterium]
MTTETLKIDGMTCGHCVAAVRNALAEVEGVDVEDVQIGEARVRYDEEKTSRDALVAAVEEEGYAMASA